MKGHLLIVGDFNYRVYTGNFDAAKFLELIHSFDLVQHVDGVTNDKGATLDLVITRTSDNFLGDVPTIDQSLPSDHAALHFTSIFERPRVSKTVISSQDFKAINIDCFKDRVVTNFSK